MNDEIDSKNKIKDLLQIEDSSPHYGTEFRVKVFWRLPNGKPHRKYGPAIEFKNGDTAWYLNGELHRDDGPAIIYLATGKQIYCRYGVTYTEEEFKSGIIKQKDFFRSIEPD